jgi:hypothetical protein
MAPPFESPEFVELFQTYTSSSTSIGAHLAEVAAKRIADHPLIVSTGTDIAYFPGAGGSPKVEPFRMSTRGFKELAAISHLGPALATLARMREHDEASGWRSDAERLLAATKATRAANSTELWVERIAVRAFAGRERSIASMVDYACRVTEQFLQRSLDDPSYLTPATVRGEYLEGPADGLHVPFTRVMIATFFLVGLDLAHRLITWFDEIDVTWENTTVIVAGQAGRPTAGTTRESNSIAGVIHTVSRDRLPADRLLIAPHAPVFPSFDGIDVEPIAVLEDEYRRLAASLLATSELGELMFHGFPRFVPAMEGELMITVDSTSVSEKPSIRNPDDWFAMTTRLRVLMEDPRQLLSGAVTDFATSQLIDQANDPSAVIVPGLDGEPYPDRGLTSRRRTISRQTVTISYRGLRNEGTASAHPDS